MTILSGSTFEGKNIEEVEADHRYDFQVEGVMREGKRVSPPLNGQPLQTNDVILVRTSPDQIAFVRQDPNLELAPVKQYEAVLEDAMDRVMTRTNNWCKPSWLPAPTS